MAARGSARRPRRAALASALAVALPVLAGCGSASEPSPPNGVDELVVPTPSVDPSDFVTGIDNRWLPLRQGATWTYDVTGQSVAFGAVGSMTVSVLPTTTRVDGVAATAVRTQITGTSSPDLDRVDLYAQDRSGNVWWLGEQGQWQAGADGAEAGLAMPGHPRYGDGYRQAYLPGVVEDRATVVGLDDAFSVDGQRYQHVLDVNVSSDLAPGITRERSYAAGVGLVRSSAVDGPAELLELVSGP